MPNIVSVEVSLVDDRLTPMFESIRTGFGIGRGKCGSHVHCISCFSKVHDFPHLRDRYTQIVAGQWRYLTSTKNNNSI